jgi:two-component system OmpR family response regulator
MRILIVDDEPLVAGVLADAILAQGHDAMVAHGGAEALQLIDRQHPDAVFLDVQMPEMNGLEVLRRLRESRPSLPVIVITGHADARDLEDAHRLGAIEIIEKPFLLNTLTEALSGLDTRAG